jgi:hypothetical protein
MSVVVGAVLRARSMAPWRSTITRVVMRLSPVSGSPQTSVSERPTTMTRLPLTSWSTTASASRP